MFSKFLQAELQGSGQVRNLWNSWQASCSTPHSGARYGVCKTKNRLFKRCKIWDDPFPMTQTHPEKSWREQESQGHHQFILALIQNLEEEYKPELKAAASHITTKRKRQHDCLTSFVFRNIFCRRMRKLWGSLFTSSSMHQRLTHSPASKTETHKTWTGELLGLAPTRGGENNSGTDSPLMSTVSKWTPSLRLFMNEALLETSKLTVWSSHMLFSPLSVPLFPERCPPPPTTLLFGHLHQLPACWDFFNKYKTNPVVIVFSEQWTWMWVLPFQRCLSGVSTPRWHRQRSRTCWIRSSVQELCSIICKTKHPQLKEKDKPTGRPHGGDLVNQRGLSVHPHFQFLMGSAGKSQHFSVFRTKDSQGRVHSSKVGAEDPAGHFLLESQTEWTGDELAENSTSTSVFKLAACSFLNLVSFSWQHWDGHYSYNSATSYLITLKWF